LGTAQFGLDYGINNIVGKPKEEEIFSILDFALHNGIKHLDTASAYGNAEEVLGRYFKLRGEEKFKIITKFSFSEKTNLTECLHDSLKKLNLNSVDTILFHSYSDYNNHRNQLNEFIVTNKKKHFKHLGVSVYTNGEIEGLVDDVNIDIIQIPYNLLDNNNLREKSFSLIKSKGKKIHIRSVFLQGLFFMPPNDLPINLISLRESIQELNNLCVEYGLDVRQLALSYVMNNNLIDGILIGVDSLTQLMENIASVNSELSDKIINRIDSIKVADKELLNPSTWKIER